MRPFDVPWPEALAKAAGLAVIGCGVLVWVAWSLRERR